MLFYARLVQRMTGSDQASIERYLVRYATIQVVYPVQAEFQQNHNSHLVSWQPTQ
jgi:hypothetical protein